MMSSRLDRVHALAQLIQERDSSHSSNSSHSTNVRQHVVEYALDDDNAAIGVTARLAAPLAAGAPILSVPLDAVLSAFTVLNDPQSPFAALPDLADALDALRAENPSSSSSSSSSGVVSARTDVVAVYLCLIVLRFGDERARLAAPPVWRAYVDALPAHVGTPLQWSEAELDLLHGTNARFVTRSLLIALWRLHDRLLPALAARFPDSFAAPLFDYPHLVWAYEMFWSRCMAVPHLHGPTLPALVPLVDLLNHDPAARVDYTTDPASRRFGLITRVPLAAGAPVCNNYGARSNERLLLLYGFALADNDVDDVQLRIGVDDEELGPHKLALLREHAASAGWDIAQRLPCDGAISPALRWTMRVLAATRLELYAWSGERVAVQLARERDLADGTSVGVGAVTARNEAASLHALASLLHERLRSICDGDIVAARQVAERLGAAAAPPSDAAAAAALLDAALREPSLPDTYRSALLYRVGQRRIVAAAAQRADALRSELASAFVLDGRALYARFVGGYASYGVTATQPPSVEFAPAVCTTLPAQASGSAEGVDVERRRTHVAPDVAFLALGAPCAAGDVLVRVPLAAALSFPGVPPSAALLGVAEGALGADELERRWKALCDALLASGFEVDDIAALWLAAERTEAERDVPAALADAGRWWRAWLLSMNAEGKSFAALAWSSTEWQAMLHTPSMVDAAAGVARALERHCDQLFAQVGAAGGAPRALFMTPQRYAWANDLIATRGVRDAASGRLCVVPLNALPAPAPSGVGCVERVVDVESQSLVLRALCALPAGAVLTEFGGECGGSSWFTAEERLLHGGFAYAPDSEHDADCGLINHFPISVSFATGGAADVVDVDDDDDDDDDNTTTTDIVTDEVGGATTILNLPDTNADLAAFDGPGSEASRHVLLSEPRIATRLLATLRSAIAGVPVTEAAERISLANEGAAIATLQNVVQEAGGRFPTRMAADQAALAVMTNGAAGDAAAALALAPALVPQRDAWLAMLERFGESHAWRVAAALSFMVGSKSAIAATWARLGDVIRALEEHRQGRARTIDDDE
jgi:hypothetical protein